MNIEEQYLSLLADVLAHGHKKHDRTGTGTISRFGRELRHSMSSGFPLLTTKSMPLKQIATELIWFLRGRTDLKWLVERNCYIWIGDAYKRYCRYAGSLEEPDYSAHVDDPHQNKTRLMTRLEFIDAILKDRKFSKRFGDMGPIYGKQWRSWQVEHEHADGTVYYKEPPVDQLKQVITGLVNDPDSRRLLVSAWAPHAIPDMILPPCHYAFQFYTRELTREERIQWATKNPDFDLEDITITEPVHSPEPPTRAISLRWEQRSVDLCLGLPFNIASYALLLELVAGAVNMVPDELSCSLGDCHIYLDHIEGAQEQISRKPYPLPQLIVKEGVQSHADDVILSIMDRISTVEPDHFSVLNYKHHPKISFPLSN